ncbi:hypothetical protein PsYK624_149100 [Phanerochaete sordida]|uniref:Uncharacterized protein n=1 Tax=Phanerochaete sordida TaxID=48140 RepID=A0A9P3GNF1_9APHY|nr:hypothetical protein PsYK624_149100 [Phanerochaete sordida]
MPLNFQTRVGSIGFRENSYNDGDSVFELIAKAESGPRSLDVTGLPAEEDVRLQALLDAVGDRLHHFCYLYRSPVFMGVLMGPPPSRPSIAAMDLSRCTSLQTFYTSVNFFSLDADLRVTICPMLRTLKVSDTLTQVVVTVWARQDLATRCNEDAARLSLSELEDVVIALRDERGVLDFVFRLLYDRTTEHLPVECTAALHDALPRLTKAAGLRVVSKDVSSVTESSPGGLKRATQHSDAVMSLVSERVPPPVATSATVQAT